MSETENMLTTDPNMEVIQMEKESAYTFRKRRHPAWTDNYTLYRGIVIPNRLTQRQSVHVPLMKYAVGSIMKEVDTPPEMYFKNLDNNHLAKTTIPIVINRIINQDEISIPNWIKNNAAWWATGQIDDKTFVQGLEFLIQNGIICV